MLIIHNFEIASGRRKHAWSGRSSDRPLRRREVRRRGGVARDVTSDISVSSSGYLAGSACPKRSRGLARVFLLTVVRKPPKFSTASTTHLPRCWSWRTTLGGRAPCTPRTRWSLEEPSWRLRAASRDATVPPTGARTPGDVCRMHRWVLATVSNASPPTPLAGRLPRVASRGFVYIQLELLQNVNIQLFTFR